MTEPAMMAVRLLEVLLATSELMVVGIRLAVVKVDEPITVT